MLKNQISTDSKKTRVIPSLSCLHITSYLLNRGDEVSQYMSQYDEHMKQLEKENYIANMLVRTLYSNDVNNSECYRIIKLFKEKVLGDVEM